MKKLVVATVLLFNSLFVIAQQNNPKDYYVARMEAIKTSKDKVAYLNEFLKDASSNPAKYCDKPQAVRDSVDQKLQIDHQVLLFSVLSNQNNYLNNKYGKKIKKNTRKAYVISIQMVYAGEYLAYRQAEMDKYILEINQLMEKSGIYKELNQL